MLPPLLKQGDKIGVVAPARKISKEELIPFVNWCESNDWEVIYSKNLFAINNQFAGTDTQKVEDINSMLANPEIKAIFCARGGYGSARIVDKIDWSFLKQNPKWICGYSDITVLHQHIQNVLGMSSLHCLMPISFKQYDFEEIKESVRHTEQFLKAGTLSYDLPDSFEGIEIDDVEVTGGNLSVLFSLMGSDSVGINNKRIVFLEDLDEYLYHIDRMATGLKRSGYFEGVKLIILGGITDMRDNTVPFGKTAIEILEEHAKELNIPVATNFPFGHIAKNFPIPINYKATIKNKQITFAAP